MGITAEGSWGHCPGILHGNGIPAPLPAQGTPRAGPGPWQSTEETPEPSLLSVFVWVQCPQTLLRLQEPFEASLLKEQQIVFKCGYLIAEISIPP